LNAFLRRWLSRGVICVAGAPQLLTTRLHVGAGALRASLEQDDEWHHRLLGVLARRLARGPARARQAPVLTARARPLSSAGHGDHRRKGAGGGSSAPAERAFRPREVHLRVDTVVANGAECEPLLRCDKAVMRERTEEVLRGLSLLREAPALLER